MANTIYECTPLLARKEIIQSKDTKSQKYRDKLWKIFSSITVEPAIFLYALSYGLESVLGTNLLIDKVCKDSYSTKVCSDLYSGKYPQQQDDVQRKTNDLNIYIHLIEYVPGVFLTLLLGAWSDLRDRKTPILLCLLGLLLKGFGMTANCYWWNLPSSYLLLAFIPAGLTGSVIGFYGAAYAYVSVVSDGRTRTTRVALLSIILHVFQPCGQAFAEVLYDGGGYVAVFGTYSLLVGVAFLYCIVRLERLSNDNAENTLLSICWTISPSNLKKTLLVAFKKREMGKRGFIIGHVIVVALYVFGRESKLYQFLFCRKKFSWNQDTYTLWSIVDMSISAAGQLLLLPVLSYVFQVQDSILGFTGSVSLLFCYILRATAPKPWIFYLSSGVGLCSEMVSASSRAALSKLVERQELGAIFAILASAEAIIPTIAPSVYTLIYNSTLDVFPGTFFLVSAGFMLVILQILTWILTRKVSMAVYQKHGTQEKEKLTDEDEQIS